MFVFGSRFIFIKAYNDRINISPALYTVEQAGDEFIWENAGNALYQDLSPRADFSQFNPGNSAYIMTLDIDSGYTGTTTAVNSFREDKVSLVNQIWRPLKSLVSYFSAWATFNFKQARAENNASTTDTQEEPGRLDFPSVPISSEEVEPLLAGITEEPENPPPVYVPLEPLSEETGTASADNIPEDASSLPAPAIATSLPPIYLMLEPATEEADDNALSEVSPASATTTEPGTSTPLYAVLEPLEETPTGSSSEDQATRDSQDSQCPGGISDVLCAKTKGGLKTSIILSDFSVPAGYAETEISNALLGLSLAAYSGYADARLVIEYSLNHGWQELGILDLGQRKLSNADFGGYYPQFALPAITWNDINNLKIRVSYESNAGTARASSTAIAVYLDAVWLEVDYREDQDETEEIDDASAIEPGEISLAAGPETEKDFELALISGLRGFEAGETPWFKFRFEKKRGLITRLFKGMADLFRESYDEYSDMEISARFQAPDGQEMPDLQFKIKYQADGKFELLLPDHPPPIPARLLFA